MGLNTPAVANGQYYVLAATSVAQALATWPRLATNYFDAGGRFTATIPVDAGIPARFFSVQVP